MRRLVLEFAVVVTGWIAYRLVRSSTHLDRTDAVENAQRVLGWERARSLDVELGTQALVDHTGALRAANFYYLGHFPVTIACAVLLYRHRRQLYLVFRNGVALTTGAALVVHAIFPLAPPRLLPAYIDAGETVGPSAYSFPGSDAANQFAAMPSMHVGWAVLVASAVVATTHPRSLMRAFGMLHPLVTVVVVVVTGHHYVADVLAGAGLAVAGWMVAVGLGRVRERATSARIPGRNSTVTGVRLTESSNVATGCASG